MKFSLQELKEINRWKNGDYSSPTPPPQSKHKVKPDRSGKCHKHGSLHLECARLGTHRTRLLRWQKNGDRMFNRGSFVSETDLKNLEETYKKASEAYHREPCTCSS